MTVHIHDWGATLGLSFIALLVLSLIVGWLRGRATDRREAAVEALARDLLQLHPPLAGFGTHKERIGIYGSGGLDVLDLNRVHKLAELQRRRETRQQKNEDLDAALAAVAGRAMKGPR